MSNKFNPNSPRAKSVDKRTAVKLINNYAESYKKKEDENALLQKHIDDLNHNLKLNKVIIKALSSGLTDDERTKEFINNLNIEINELYLQNKLLMNRLEESNSKVPYIFISDRIFRENCTRQHKSRTRGNLEIQGKGVQTRKSKFQV